MKHRFGHRLHNARGATPRVDRVTITHPNHPFKGKSLTFLGLHGPSIKLKGQDGRTLRIPRDWTDFEESDNQGVQAITPPLLSIDGLRELVRFFNTREVRARIGGAPRQEAETSANNEQVSD